MYYLIDKTCGHYVETIYGGEIWSHVDTRFASHFNGRQVRYWQSKFKGRFRAVKI